MTASIRKGTNSHGQFIPFRRVSGNDAFRAVPSTFSVQKVPRVKGLHMLTNNTITDIDPGGECVSFTFSMVPQALQEHVMRAKYQTIDHNYVPAPCGVINCYQGAGTPAERNRLDNGEYRKTSDRNDRFNAKLCLL